MINEVDTELDEITEIETDEARVAKPKAKTILRKKEKVEIMKPVKAADANKDEISHEADDVSEDLDEVIDEAEENSDEDSTFFDELGNW